LTTLDYFTKQMWTEKYRPTTLDEVVGHDEVKEELRGYLQMGNMPHLLFTGPPGCGKTSLAIAFAKDFLGDLFDYNFTSLNASDERGIDTIRGKIKDFCRTAPLLGGLKILLLDEADYITADAQAALRGLMESYPVARLILTANYPDNIIDAIKSRCRQIKLQPLESFDVVEKLKKIAEMEGIDVGYQIYTIAEECEGDLRNAIIRLQSIAGSCKSKPVQIL